MSRFLDELNVTPLADGISWRLNTDFRYESDVYGGVLVARARMISDFTSSPRALWWKYPPWNTYGAGAVIHDLPCYWDQGMPRDMADAILREAMHVLAVDEKSMAEIYAGVHLFGESAWERNAALKKSGYTRMAGIGSNPPYASLPI